MSTVTAMRRDTRPHLKANVLPMDTDVQVRCWRCDRLLAERVGRPWDITCQRCKAKNKAPTSQPA
jgi:hypothetical protein